MKIFGTYAHYYDLLYKDKDYKGEITYINSFIKKYNADAKTVLDLGCGTGIHAQILMKRGYKVHGIDISRDMLLCAKDREYEDELSFSQGDIRDVQLGQKFDVAISLFHVISYQNSNSDLYDAFKTAYEHLEDSGIFIFDCWYGPGVLTDPPEVRVKRLENEYIKVTRIAEPTMHPNKNLVDVNYHVFIRNLEENKVDELKETHTMRYIFKPEIEQLFNLVGFEMLECVEYMTNEEPTNHSWNVLFVGKKF
jgi:SAM-dependent methyltransferase